MSIYFLIFLYFLIIPIIKFKNIIALFFQRELSYYFIDSAIFINSSFVISPLPDSL